MYGLSDPGSVVTVSFNGSSVNSTASTSNAELGFWKVTLKAMAAAKGIHDAAD